MNLRLSKVSSSKTSFLGSFASVLIHSAICPSFTLNITVTGNLISCISRASPKPVNVSGNSYDRDGIETGIEYDDFDILNFGISSKIHNVDYAGETEAIMTIAVRANIEVECSFFDEDNSTWDYEEPISRSSIGIDVSTNSMTSTITL